MFERFTGEARCVVVLAQEEARLLNHNYIDTEHILLGLIHEGEGVAAKALESLGISLEAVRSQVKETIGQGGKSPSGYIPFTPRAKKVLEPWPSPAFGCCGTRPASRSSRYSSVRGRAGRSDSSTWMCLGYGGRDPIGVGHYGQRVQFGRQSSQGRSVHRVDPGKSLHFS